MTLLGCGDSSEAGGNPNCPRPVSFQAVFHPISGSFNGRGIFLGNQGNEDQVRARLPPLTQKSGFKGVMGQLGIAFHIHFFQYARSMSADGRGAER